LNQTLLTNTLLSNAVKENAESLKLDFAAPF